MGPDVTGTTVFLREFPENRCSGTLNGDWLNGQSGNDARDPRVTAYATWVPVRPLSSSCFASPNVRPSTLLRGSLRLMPSWPGARP